MSLVSLMILRQQSVMYGDSSIIQRTKEHCLVGVKARVTGTGTTPVPVRFLGTSSRTSSCAAERRCFADNRFGVLDVGVIPVMYINTSLFVFVGPYLSPQKMN